MAEGEDPFANDFPIREHNLDYDDDDEQEVNRTRPFYPGASSTPYHGGEQYEMRTIMHEQSGLPDTSYEEEVPFLRRTGSITDLYQESDIAQKMKRAIDMIKAKFPRADIAKLQIRRGTGKKFGKNCCQRSKRRRVQDLKR